MTFNEQVLAVAEDRTKARREQYESALRRLRPAGCGHRTHQALLGIANRGIRAGRAASDISADIHEHLPPGARVVTDREIRNAINKALAEVGQLPM